MPTAIAYSRGSESSRVSSLLPSEIRGDSADLITFIEEYYRYLSGPGQPSNIISSVTDERDIDRIPLQYLSSISEEIAKNIPGASAIDKVNLYKKIVQYYSTRGTEDSVAVFFKIFFDEIVEISYPKEQMLRVSSDGYLSSSNRRIQDSRFYQDFSYLIKCSIPVSEWEYSFSRLVHPAGLKLFAQIALYLSVKTDVPSWKSTRKANHIYEDTLLLGHSPEIQPGWLSDALRTLLFVIYGSAEPSEDDVRSVYLSMISATYEDVDNYYRHLHEIYGEWKFLDTTEISAYSSMNPFGSYVEDGSFFSTNYSTIGSYITIGAA